MKAVVTGGTGFLGSALVEYLLFRGDEVVVIDNMADPALRPLRIPCQRRWNSWAKGTPRLKSPTYTLLPHDVTQMSELTIPGVDWVFHFACHYANEKSLEEPIEDVRVNALGTMAMLEFCRRNGVARVMYASTSGIYGMLDEGLALARDWYLLVV